MKTVIWLKTARVYGQNDDNTPKVERTTVKLEDGDNFKKFVNHMHLKGFMKSEPPHVEKVMTKDEKNNYQEIDKTQWQEYVEQALRGKQPQKAVDYKELATKQSELIEQMQKRLEALEGNTKSEKRLNLEKRAKELGIKFRDNIGDDKLEAKINAQS